MTSLNDLLLQKQVLLEELITQIKKDLTLSGIDKEVFDNIVNSEDLQIHMQGFITDLISYQADDFNRFMYRVDVPEKKLSGILHTQLEEVAAQLSLLILQREIQKTIFRKQFGT
jgi:hypothetical protein